MIPAEVIAEIRSRNDLVAFVESAGVQLRRRGADYIGLCPFHADHHTPSLVVSPRKQYWCCHGACSAGGGKRVGGDVIEFARRLWNVGFLEAVARLNGGSAPSERAALPEAAKEKSTPVPALLERLAGYYQQNLARSHEAQKYLASRGITRPELLTALQAGFSDGSLAGTMSEASPVRKELQAAGLITANGSEFFFRCVVLPLRDLAGVIVGMYGRAIDRDQHLFLPGPRRGLLNAACAATADEIVITESVIDAMSFLEAGIPNVIPIYGVNGWTEDHDELIEKHRIRRVVLALDSDDAGQKASAAIGERLTRRAIDVRSVVLPAKDPNELLAREGAARFAEVWRELAGSRAASVPLPSSLPSAAAALPEAAKEESIPAIAPSPEEAAPLLRDPAAGGYLMSAGPRLYRVKGLTTLGGDHLKITLRVEQDGRFHVDTFDLYSARSRRSFIEDVTEAFGAQEQAMLHREIDRLIDALELERQALKDRGRGQAPKASMTPADREEAMDFLMARDLVAKLREDFAAVGCVGEETAMLIGYLAALSRKLPWPLAVLFCARSGAGKSNMQVILTGLIPPEDLIMYTRVTSQALFYKDENALVHKLLAIDEEEGAAEAAYALRNLQSAGYLSISATCTDPQTGKQRAVDYRVNGPTAIFLTTAHPEALDYETRNRFVILTVDESKEQTRRILEKQRWEETVEGLVASERRRAVLRRHHNAQRLLQPVAVVNPFAERLAYPSDRLILRREQKKYLTLIRTIALLHQHQRPKQKKDAIEYIDVCEQDVEIASELAPMILRRNLDELAPPTRLLLAEIRKLVEAKMKEQSVTQQHALIHRDEIQKAAGYSAWHVKTYIPQLIEFEYLRPVAGCKGKRYFYELLWDGREEDPASAMKNVLRK